MVKVGWTSTSCYNNKNNTDKWEVRNIVCLDSEKANIFVNLDRR